MKTYMVRFGQVLTPKHRQVWAVQSTIGTCIVQHYVGYFWPAVPQLFKFWFTTEKTFWSKTSERNQRT